VNGLVNRFFEARKMMTSMASGKMPGMPGLPGMAGGNGARKPAVKSGKTKNARGVSGNPAKRNAPQQPVGTPVDPAAAFGAGGSDAFDQAALEKAMAEFQLPPELRGRLGS
jgi:signal recognition particle subunit SRP54